jgi:hypothetical protein
LDDQRFTRSVTYHRDFYFSHSVLRVSDCAYATLTRIANRDFVVPKVTWEEGRKTDERAEAKRGVQSWWRELQSKGEEGLLIEATRRGDRNSPAQAKKLLKSYPEAAIDAIAAGARAAKDAWTRTELVNAALAINGEAPVVFFRDEMQQAPSLQTRVAAARGLFQRGMPEAVPAMIEEWENALPKLRHQQPDQDYEIGALLCFLAKCGKAEALDAVGHDLRQRPIEVRLTTITTLVKHDGPFSLGAGGKTIDSWPEPEGIYPSDIDEAAEAATERLLVSSLDDTEARDQMSIAWGNTSFTNPRICDLAAFALTTRWPQKYAFDASATEAERDAQLVQLTNAWRTTHNLAPAR